MSENKILASLFKELQILNTYFSPYWLVVGNKLRFLFPYLTVLLVFSVVVIVIVVFNLVRLCLLWLESKRAVYYLEIAPPALSEQSSFTTAQLFTCLHGLLRQRSFWYRLFQVSKSCSLEIYSTKETGIRYVIRVLAEDETILKKNLIAYLPGIKVTKIDDYLPSFRRGHILDIGLSRHFAFPLKKQDNLKEYDPMAYITGTMTKLAEDELVAMQTIISPVNHAVIQKVNHLRAGLMNKKDILTGLQTKGISNGFWSLIFRILLQLLMLPLGLMVWVVSGGKEGPLLLLNSYNKKYADSTYRDILETQIKQKIDQELFTASVRWLTLSKSRSNIGKIERGFMAALSPFSNAPHQSLRSKGYTRLKFIYKILFWLYQKRRLGFFNNPVLSSSELSDVYHFAYTRTTKTENLFKLHSQELPAPLSLKKKAGLDLHFAKNTFGGSDTPIGLTLDERRRHVYILGATGTGKSTMLLSMIKQDIEHGKGICVIDPHGDLTEQIIAIIPKKRIADVVYFNPDDIAYPIGINLLELSPGLEDEDAIREKEYIAESIISVFQKLYTDKYSGPRMEYILRNTIHTAFTIPDASLFTIYKLLINSSFRKSVVWGLTDENLKEFWKYEFAKAGDFQKVKMISPITNKIGRFLFSPTAKRILEQGKSTINFDAIMNDGKILLCNLAKGKIGEDNSSVFGVLIMAKIQLAALKRARMKPEDRKDFYLYVDEFQNFATPAFSQILSEARKYRLNAILAHQTTSQIEDKSLINVTLANSGTVICFRTANPEDERMILPQFRPYIEQGAIAGLPSYHFYMRLGALNPEEPFSGVTVPVQIQYSQQRVDEVIESSRKLYAKKYTRSVEVISKPKEIKEAKKVDSVLP